jgi:hypothetical protein
MSKSERRKNIMHLERIFMENTSNSLSDPKQSDDDHNVSKVTHVSSERRLALTRIGKVSAYAAPATLALLTMQAKATSLSC